MNPVSYKHTNTHTQSKFDTSVASVITRILISSIIQDVACPVYAMV